MPINSCNVTQNERGGKSLLLKICADLEITIGSSDTVTATAHDLKVGDLIRPAASTLPGTVAEITADQIYYVVAVPTANTFKISATIAGSAIVFTDVATFDVESFRTVGGLRTAGAAFASDAIESSNYGSNQWREIIDGAGMRQYSVSGDGIYTKKDSFITLRTKARANELVCLAFIDTVDGEILVGCFKITALEVTGAYDGEANFTLSAVSSGEVNIVNAA